MYIHYNTTTTTTSAASSVGHTVAEAVKVFLKALLPKPEWQSMEMSRASKNAKEALHDHGLSIAEQRRELEIEYDRWKTTAVSLLQGMKESSNSFGEGKDNYNADGYLDEKGRIGHMTSIQSDVRGLQHLIEQRPTNVKRQGQLCHKHRRTLRHKVTKVSLTGSSHQKYDVSNSYGIKYTRNDYARQIVFGRLPRESCTTNSCRKRKCCSGWTVNAGIGGEPGQFSVFDITILFIIVANTLVLFLESQDIYYGRLESNLARSQLYGILHTVFLVLFTLEAILKMAALGEKENFFCRLGIEAYFQSRWNVFDFVILFFGWIGSLFVFTYGRTTTTLRVFRLFRAIRAFRLFSAIKIIIDAVVHGTRYVFFMVFLFYCSVYLFSLAGQSIFHNAMRSVCMRPEIRNNVTRLVPIKLDPPYRCIADCATVFEANQTCPPSELRFLGGVQCNTYDPDWVCGIGPQGAEYNYDNFDSVWEAFKTASTFMFQRTWQKEYGYLVQSRSTLLAFTYYFFLIMVRILTDLFITSILCVVLTNVRDAHFKKAGIVTTHYKKLKRQATFRRLQSAKSVRGGLKGEGPAMSKTITESKDDSENDQLLDDYDKAKDSFVLPRLPWRTYIREKIVLTRSFEYFIYFVIILNAITMAVLSNDTNFRTIAFAFRVTFALIYLAEVLLKVAAFTFFGYFQINRFNWLDFFVAISGLVYIVLGIADNSTVDQNDLFAFFQTFRLIRILRIVRLIKAFPSIWDTSQVILNSYYMIMLLAIFIVMTNFVFAVFMTAIAGETMSKDNLCSEGNGVYGFRSLYHSLLTLFVSFVASGWEKLRFLCRNEAFVTGTMLIYVAVISNVLSRIAIAVVVSNFEASDHERKEYNKDRFKAVAEVQFLERRLTRCTATVRLSYLHAHATAKLSHKTSSNSAKKSVNAQRISSQPQGRSTRSHSVGNFDSILGKSPSLGTTSSSTPGARFRDKIDDEYTEHLDQAIDLLRIMKSRTIDFEDTIPTDTMRTLREVIRDTIKHYICPRILHSHLGRFKLSKGVVQQILDFLPLLTDKFGNSQLNHCIKLTMLMIDLIQLQIVAPTILNPKDVKENPHFVSVVESLKKLGFASFSHGKRMMTSSLLKSNNALLKNINESFQDDSDTSGIPVTNTSASNAGNLSVTKCNNCKGRLPFKVGMRATRRLKSCANRVITLTILLLIILYMFALVGFMMLYNRVGTCVTHEGIKSKQECLEAHPYAPHNATHPARANNSSFEVVKWEPNPKFNFDTFGSSLMVMFDLLALNNVESVMEGVHDTNLWYVLFPTIYILVVPMFLIHLYAGVLVTEVSRAFGTFLLTGEQRMWINKQREINGISPIVTFAAPPRNNCIRLFFYNLIMESNNNGFKPWVVYLVNLIILSHNIVSMVLIDETGFDYENSQLKAIDIVVFGIYSVELLAKFVAIGKNNFRSVSFSVSLFLLSITTLVYIVQTAVIGTVTTFPTVFLRFRIAILLRDLTHKVRSLQVVKRTFMLSLPGILNVFVIPYGIITLLFWAVGIQLLSSKLGYFDIVVLLFRIFSGGDFSHDIRVDYGCGAASIIYIVLYFLVARCVLLNAFFAVVLDNFKTVYTESQNLLPLAGWEVYFFRSTWFRFDPDGRAKIPAFRLKDFIDAFAEEVHKKKNGELMSRKIQLLHNLQDNIRFDQQGTNFNDVDLVRTDERWKRSFVKQVIDSAGTMEPEISFSKSQLLRNTLAAKLNSGLHYTPEANVLQRQSVSEFNEVPDRSLSHQKILPGNTGSEDKKNIKAVSFHAVLRELMQKRLAQHFLKLREDLRIEILAETSEQSNGCIVCFTQAKSERSMQKPRASLGHIKMFKELVIKCAVRYVHLIRFKNKLKERVRGKRAGRSLLNP